MATKDDSVFFELVRSNPVQFLLVSGIPVLLAVVQLANSLYNELSFFVSVPFAIVMVLFGVLLTQHHFAEFRRRQFERSFYG